MANVPVKPSPAQIIRNLYRNIDVGRQSSTESAMIYGELTPAGVAELSRYLEMTEQDVFYDIGSGAGKLVLQLAISLKLKSCVGIEIAAERYHASCLALDRARKLGLLRARHCSFRHEDAQLSDLSGATVIYTCSTCFPVPTLYRLACKISELPNRPAFITLKPLHPKKPRGMELIDGIELATSWNPRQSAFVYRVGSGP